MRIRRVHFLWLIPLALLTCVGGAGWWFVDALHYGNATPLHRAILNDDVERARMLIHRGADVNATMRVDLFPDTWGATPLHLAAARNDDQLIELLLATGADVDAIDELGFTPLHMALRYGCDAAALALIHSEASVHASARKEGSGYALQNYGQPIRTALEKASAPTVLAMIEAGADPQSDIGDDAMAYANAPDLLTKLQILEARGISVDGRSSRGCPLHIAAANNDVDAIAFLLEHGADIDARGGDCHFTALLRAAYAGANDAVMLLIESGADSAAGTDDFGSPVYAAAFSGKRETVRLLLSLHLQIDLQAGRASDGATPLHMAYWNGDEEMAQMLIEAGANPRARTNDGRLPPQFRR